MAEIDVVKFGIKVLDEILLGGVPRANVILVKGTVGSGKTLLGIEFIYRGITEFDEPGIIIVFETSPDKLIRDAASLGFNLRDLQDRHKLQIIFTQPQVLLQELNSSDSLLLETVAEIGAKRIFIDGFSLLRSVLSHTPRDPLLPLPSYRESVQRVIEWLNREQLSAMISCELGVSSESQLTAEAPEFLADTVIHLKRSAHRRATQRSIEIIKSRGQNYDAGEHTMQIGDRGVQVYRRVQAPLKRSEVQPSSLAKYSAIGVPALDSLLGGGVFDGSTTMVVGVSGVGKTVLGTQVLLEGARNLQLPGLLVSLDEHPAQIARNASTIGLAMQEQIDNGTLHVLFESPQELNIDIHFAQITEAIEKHNIRRLVIDGMTSYSTALHDQAVYRDFFHALVAYSKDRLMTTFFNYENPEFLGLSSFMPDFPVSSIVDNIILLSLVEINSSLRRCITVVKARGCAHEFDSREYTIGQGGIQLGPVDPEAPKPKPFASYSSILSRAPTRLLTSVSKSVAGV